MDVAAIRLAIAGLTKHGYPIYGPIPLKLRLCLAHFIDKPLLSSLSIGFITTPLILGIENQILSYFLLVYRAFKMPDLEGEISDKGHFACEWILFSWLGILQVHKENLKKISPKTVTALYMMLLHDLAKAYVPALLNEKVAKADGAKKAKKS
jgi:hypothetical protein